MRILNVYCLHVSIELALNRFPLRNLYTRIYIQYTLYALSQRIFIHEFSKIIS